MQFSVSSPCRPAATTGPSRSTSLACLVRRAAGCAPRAASRRGAAPRRSANRRRVRPVPAALSRPRAATSGCESGSGERRQENKMIDHNFEVIPTGQAATRAIREMTNFGLCFVESGGQQAPNFPPGEERHVASGDRRTAPIAPQPAGRWRGMPALVRPTAIKRPPASARRSPADAGVARQALRWWAVGRSPKGASG